MSQERIEAAAEAVSEINGMRFDGFWSRLDELEPEDRNHAIAEARFALERSDAILFSDEAIERAAKDFYTEFEAQPIYDEATERFTGHRLWEWLTPESQERYKARIRSVVAALKGDA